MRGRLSEHSEVFEAQDMGRSFIAEQSALMDFFFEIAKKIIRGLRSLQREMHQILVNCIDWLIVCFPWREPSSNSVLLVRLDEIGDFILWLDTAKTFRCLYPGKKIVLCANAIWADLAECFPYWDEVIAIDPNRLFSDLWYRIKVFSYLCKQRFQIAIQPTFSRKYWFGDSMIRVTGAKKRIGSQGDLSNISPHHKRISDTWYTQLIPAEAASLMEIKRNNEFLRGLGGKAFDGHVAKIEKLLDLSGELRIEGPYFIVFPGAAWRGKIWPANRFAEVITRIRNLFGWTAVLCGSCGEKSICDEIVQLSVQTPVNLAGKTSLIELVEVIRNAKLLVGNDTSAVHIAVATDTPTVCILGGGHFGRFMPYALDKKECRPLPIAVINKMDCFGCGWGCIHPTKPEQPFPCIDRIDVVQVVDACIQAALMVTESR